MLRALSSISVSTISIEQPVTEPNIPSKRGHLDRDEILLRDTTKEGQGSPPLPVPLTRPLQEWRRIVLLSEPGAGKSITLQYIAYCFAAKKEGLAAKKLGLYEDCVPILLSLRDVTEGVEKRDLKKSWLEQWLADAVLSVVKATPSEVEHLIERWRKDGRLFVLLDGLDEVPERLRDEVSKKIEYFVGKPEYRRSRVLVTSRKEGYRRLNADIIAYELQPLTNSEDIFEYFVGWIQSLRPDYSIEEVKEKAFHLLEHTEAHPGLNQVVKNPLFLRLLVSMYVSDRQIPENKNYLLWSYLEEAWKRARALKVLPFGFDDVVRSLEVLAWKINTQGERNVKILSEIIQKEVNHINDGKELIEFLRTEMGLLVEKGDSSKELIDFWHSIFRTYFVTLYLKRVWENDFGQLWKFLKSRLHHKDWKGSITLLAGELEPERTTELVRLILYNNSDSEEILKRDLLLAGECLVNGASLDDATRFEILERFNPLLP